MRNNETVAVTSDVIPSVLAKDLAVELDDADAPKYLSMTPRRATAAWGSVG